MGKNKKGGKKFKKQKKNNSENLRKHNILFAENEYGQYYFTVTKMLGDGRCLGNGSDGRTDVLLIIRGSMRKKVWIHTGDVVLASYREFTSGKPIADIFHKYSIEEVSTLKKQGVVFLNVNLNKNDDEIIDNDDIGFTFEDL